MKIPPGELRQISIGSGAGSLNTVAGCRVTCGVMRRYAANMHGRIGPFGYKSS